MGFNLYALLAGGALLLGLGGTIAFQNGQIHHYHNLSNCYSTGQDCSKGFKGDTVPSLQATIKGMTEAQNKQTEGSDKNIVRVVQGPRELTEVIKEIHDAPAVGPCTVPVYKEDVNNAF